MGSRGGGSGSSSFGRGVGKGAGEVDILDKMMKNNYHVPWEQTLFGRMQAFARKGSNDRTLTRGEADYPFRGGFYTGTRQDREFDHGRR